MYPISRARARVCVCLMLPDEEHSAMLLVQRLGNRDLTTTEVEAMHLRKTRKTAIRDSLRAAHER